jgi:hypothetical protein
MTFTDQRRTPDPFLSTVNGLVHEFRFTGRRMALVRDEGEATMLVDALQMVCIHAVPSPRPFGRNVVSDYRWRVDLL